jgi:hypothetical protein
MQCITKNKKNDSAVVFHIFNRKIYLYMLVDKVSFVLPVLKEQLVYLESSQRN